MELLAVDDSFDPEERARLLAAIEDAIEQRDDNRIVAMCRRGKERQAIDITEVPAPKERPAGAEWIEAYREWRRGR